MALRGTYDPPASAPVAADEASDTEADLTPTELGSSEDEAFADLPPPPPTPPGDEDEAAPTESGISSQQGAPKLPEVELLAAAALHEPEPVPTTGFVVSIAKRGKHRKLHLLEGCR